MYTAASWILEEDAEAVSGERGEVRGPGGRAHAQLEVRRPPRGRQLPSFSEGTRSNSR